MLNLVLASASPRRRELLAQAGYSFQVHPAHILEDPHPGEDPIAYVVRLAREKADAVYRQIINNLDPANPQMSGAPEPGAPEPALSLSKACPELVEGGLELQTWESTTLDPHSLVVLGADTTVVLDNQIFGKPNDPADATRMLRLLSGRTHRVVTGVAVVTTARTEVAAEVTAVKFLTLSDDEITAYIATGEPMDKAGAYAIQGRAARWIPRIEGDYFNVVGLPLVLVSTILEACSGTTGPSGE
jgi:septum formation protein